MSCPICSSSNQQKLYDSVLPYSSAVLSHGSNRAADAELQLGIMVMSLCTECGFVYNSNFSLEKLNEQYESESYSVKNILPGEMSKNISYVFDSIMAKVKQTNIAIEIGSGRGDLAINLASRFEKVFTVDPSVNSLEICDVNNVYHHNTFFSMDLLHKIEQPDLIVARHLLEHINNPAKFLTDIAEFSKNSKCLIYIEIPNFEEILASKRFYDVFIDHFGYYLPSVFENILMDFNLKVIDTITMFKHQHIGYFCEYVPTQKRKESSQQTICVDTVTIEKRVLALAHQKDEFNRVLDHYHKVVVWGAGAHGITLYNTLTKKNKTKLLFYVDNDIGKQGKFIPNSSLMIERPEEISHNNIDCIIISAALYEDEISEYLAQLSIDIAILKPTSC